jgi:hypothetical protein
MAVNIRVHLELHRGQRSRSCFCHPHMFAHALPPHQLPILHDRALQDSNKHESTTGLFLPRLSVPSARQRQNSSGRDGSLRKHMDAERRDASADGAAGAHGDGNSGLSSRFNVPHASYPAALNSRDLFVAPLRTHLNAAAAPQAEAHHRQSEAATPGASVPAPAFITTELAGDQLPGLATHAGPGMSSWHPQV